MNLNKILLLLGIRVFLSAVTNVKWMSFLLMGRIPVQIFSLGVRKLRKNIKEIYYCVEMNHIRMAF